MAFPLQMEEFLGPSTEYNEEEEERKYYRRKRLGVIKNVLAASFGAMIVYSVYMGESDGKENDGLQWQQQQTIEKHWCIYTVCVRACVCVSALLQDSCRCN